MELITKQEAKAQGLKLYFTGKPCPKGHIEPRLVGSGGCRECGRIIARERMRLPHVKARAKAAKKTDRYKAQQAEYARRPEVRARIRHLDQTVRKESKKEYREKNKENMRAYLKTYYKENREQLLIAVKAYYAKPEIAEKRKEYIRQWTRDFLKTEAGTLANAMRKMVHRCVKNKRDRTHDVIGYRSAELKARLESLFLEGMTWENHGEWHIDHIKPIAAFHKEGVTCPKIINALENLQPLWAFDNLSKGAKY